MKERTRCFWCAGVPEFEPYHDEEWGFPVADDTRLFEKLCLESFQSGLSWRTILNKRDAFRAAFAGFDIEKVARFGARDISRLLGDAGIVRHRGKIEAAINNAQRACELTDEVGSIAAHVWAFEPAPAERPKRITKDVIYELAQTPASEMLAKDLKERGWKFFGPTTSYAFMQAMGLVNDHTEDCFVRAQATRARKNFEKPG